MPAVSDLYVYPVKGMSPQRLSHVELTRGAGFPHDRKFALARPEGLYRPGKRTAVPKQEFYVLATDGRIAAISTEVDVDTGIFIARVAGRVALEANISAVEGRSAVVRFFARVLDLPDAVLPLYAHEDGRRFTDVSVVEEGGMNWISMVNLASVRDLEARTGTEVDPLRFRANVYVDGLAPWSELGLVGEEFEIDGARVRGRLETRRCAATEVDPATGERNLPVVRMIADTFGHQLMGVYVEVLTDGVVKAGGRVYV